VSTGRSNLPLAAAATSRHAPHRYKAGLVGALPLNIVPAGRAIVTAWVLVLEFIATLALALSIRWRPAGCLRSRRCCSA
jgi:Na+/H+ antiporter NhaB